MSDIWWNFPKWVGVALAALFVALFYFVMGRASGGKSYAGPVFMGVFTGGIALTPFDDIDSGYVRFLSLIGTMALSIGASFIIDKLTKKNDF